MLRTGHRLLANALINTHLGRGNIFSSFFFTSFSHLFSFLLQTGNDRLVLCIRQITPHTSRFLLGFSIRLHRHRAVVGTECSCRWNQVSPRLFLLIYSHFLRRTLVSQFPECGFVVAVATDLTLYQPQVFTASHGDSNTNY